MVETTNTSGSRYRGLIISIALFLTLIGVLLAFTFYTSNLLEKNTALVDTSNQTANNAQAVIKDLFDLQNSQGEHINSPHLQRVRQRLAENSASIDKQLAVMEQGGTYIDTTGHQYTIAPLSSEATLSALTNSKQEWQKLQPRIAAYLDGADDIRVDSSNDLAQAYEQAKTSSLLMNDALSDLTREVFNSAERQAATIRLIQLLGVAAIFAYFLIFIFFFVRRLREADASAEAARRETTEIMETVNTGLFLLDKDLNIGQQHSRALEGIIGSNRLSGENFTNVLRNRISDKDLDTTKQFIEQLYNPRVKEKLVDDLNPLQKVMLHSDEAVQGEENRYLDFKFSRVYDDKDIARILVNVQDVSAAVRLEQRLEKERAQNDLQIEMLATILNVKPKTIQEFITNTKQHIDKINNVLKNPGSSQFELENKLKSIYREMHSLKGEASALKLHSFTKIASDAEDKLFALQNQGKLAGNDFLPLAVHLDELLNLSNTIEMLGERINQASTGVMMADYAQRPSLSSASSSSSQHSATSSNHHSAASFNRHSAASSNRYLADDISIPAPEPVSNDVVSINLDDKDAYHNSDLIDYYQDFAAQIAERQGKKVNLDTSSLTTVDIPSSLNSVIREISIQLLRNSIVHGIETPRTRVQANKSAAGLVVLDMKQSDGRFLLNIADDGQGINYERIRRRLIEMQRYDVTAARALSNSDLLRALFSSGFTTRDSADEDGGRGVGLDIIKERVKETGGKLSVHSEPNKGTRFMISLPIL